MEREAGGIAMRMGIHAAAVFAVMVGAAGVALGQPKLPSPIFEEGKSLAEATQEAKAKHRMLMVYFEGNDPIDQAEFERRTLRNPTLWAFARWHCVAIKIPCRVPAPARLTGDNRGSRPTVKVYIDGEDVCTRCMEQGMVGGGSDQMPQLPGGPPTANFIRPRQIPTPLKILFCSDFAKDCKTARDPVWGMLHERDCPMPEAPAEPEPLYSTADDLAPVVRDPMPEEKIGVLDRLDEARRLVRSGDLYQATGLYTWLWERAPQLDPAFRPARMSALVQDMSALAFKRPGSGERFTKLRDVRSERILWADYTQMHDWIALNAACNNPEETVNYLDFFVNDEDEGGMIPPADRMAYRFLSRREDYAKAWERPKEPVARVRAIVDRLEPRWPAQVTETAREDYRSFAKQYVLDEGCRVYAASLVKGDEESARLIAEMLIKARNDAMTRLSLVTTALSAEPAQARPVHLEWIAQAEKLDGTPRPDLRNRVVLGSGSGPAK